MKAVINSGNKVSEVIRIPSSKSQTHRILIAAALADGPSVIHCPALNQDTWATIEALRKLNVSIEIKENTVRVSGGADVMDYDGSVINCHESGSTLRFLIPLLVKSGKECRFSGEGKLMQRPLEVYQQIYGSSGIFELKDNILTVRGSNERPLYRIIGNISSQFISGLLFALPLEEHDSRIEIEPPVESLSYVDMTIGALSLAGINAVRNENIIMIPGNQKYRPFSCTIAGDDSQAAFFIMQAMMRKRAVRIQGIDPASRQGDNVILAIAEKAGAEISLEDDILTVSGSQLWAINSDLSDCPDLGPILFAAAALCPQTSVFTGVSRLRLKESDRIAAMKSELEKIGCVFEENENEVKITGVERMPGGYEFDGHNDHRVVMAMAILSSCGQEPSIINGIEAVNKSYPDFFEDLRKTSAEVSVHD
ncbi:MAG: 3-phosphoshikimate 1-carboxyvinyltransferase [Erysipelotrichaceae bacterium]|nr:3-phosphoshikimate 1-carboxyvinyltransferase [Erysipelotrichaceae bacterium]